jgi:methionyl aminopeptidase
VAIPLKSKKDIAKMSKANKIVAQTLKYLEKEVHPGMSLLEINAMGEDFILTKGATPAFKGLYGFPAGVCTSVNQVIIHGIPTEYEVQEGDVLGLDIGTKLDGWFGDAAITMGVGKISKQDEELIACSKDALYHAIDFIRAGMRFKELSYELENFIHSRGFVPLRSFCGHGLGRKPHEEPEIPNYLEGNNPKQGPKIKNGMVFCLEPMICQRENEAKILEDKWSVTSTDGLRGSHYEHAMAIINNKAEILSVE